MLIQSIIVKLLGMGMEIGMEMGVEIEIEMGTKDWPLITFRSEIHSNWN